MLSQSQHEARHGEGGEEGGRQQRGAHGGPGPAARVAEVTLAEAHEHLQPASSSS